MPIYIFFINIPIPFTILISNPNREELSKHDLKIIFNQLKKLNQNFSYMMYQFFSGNNTGVRSRKFMFDSNFSTHNVDQHLIQLHVL